MLKRKCLWLVMAFAIVLGSAAIGPESASACSCAIVSNVGEAKQNSDAVFDGTVTGKKSANKLFSSSSADPVTWTFNVHEVWKGKVAPVISVTSAASDESCGFEFQEGQRYVVYARHTGDTLEVSLCSRTALHSAAGQDLTDLGAGSVPPQPAAADSQAGAVMWWLMPLAAVAILASIAIYRGRKKSKTF